MKTAYTSVCPYYQINNGNRKQFSEWNIHQKINERPDNSGQAAKLTNDLRKFKLNRFCVQHKDFWIENIRGVFFPK